MKNCRDGRQSAVKSLSPAMPLGHLAIHMEGKIGKLQLATEAIAAAAIDSSLWVSALEAVSDAAGGRGAILIPVRGELPDLPYTPSVDAAADGYIRGGWVNRDERKRGVHLLERQGVFTDLDYTGPDEIARSPFYQDYLGPLGLRWFAGVKVACADDLWCVAIQRTIQQGPFLAEEAERLEQLSQHLGAAAAVSRALGFARAEGALSAFEISRTAAVLLDRFGQVLRMNPAAEAMMGSDIDVRQRRIVSRSADATTELDRVLHRALLTSGTSAVMPPVGLPRVLKRPALAYVLRVPSITQDAFAAGQAIIILVDPDRHKPPAEAMLQAGFNLTAAEARLARALASGAALERAADELGISYETSRSRLKSIFSKMDIHRQAELAALLGRLTIAP
jgi:DNA-binding CsgD family transcriptional regulator/PAS domain-containing protein